MSEHRATVRWTKTTESFAYKSYNREHRWIFPHGAEVAASAAPDFLGREDAVDPEQAFVAALSACHMLTFLALCARKNLVVESYTDDAVGVLDKNADKQLVMTRIDLHPKVRFAAGTEPDAAALAKLHHSAHEHCFLANSVRTEVKVCP